MKLCEQKFRVMQYSQTPI